MVLAVKASNRTADHADLHRNAVPRNDVHPKRVQMDLRMQRQSKRPSTKANLKQRKGLIPLPSSRGMFPKKQTRTRWTR